MTSAELAEKLGCPFEGTPRELSGAAPLESATETELSFVSGEKAFAAGNLSAAGCLIVPDGYRSSSDQSLIWGDPPRAVFARAVALLYGERPLQPGVHPSAYVAHDVAIAATAEIGPLCTVAQGTVIGPHTSVGAGCHLGANVHVGAHCVLHTGVHLYDRTRIGDRAVLHSGCVLGADGFGFVPQDGAWVKFPQVGYVEIEDDVEIGANTCVDRGALGRTRIGAGSKLDNMVHIGHNCDIGRHVVIAAQTGLSGGVVVGDGAVIGGQVGIGDKARIEPGVILGSASGVLTSKIVRGGAGPLWGTPARPLREYLEQLAAFARLPELRRELKDMAVRLAELERAREDQP